MKIAILMPWGRVGSNLMMAYLRSITKGGYANEPLNSVSGIDAQVNWVNSFYNQNAEGDLVCKLTIRSFNDVKSIENTLLVNKVKVIKMFRENHVKTAVSQIRAEQYAAFTKEKTGNAQWAVKNSEQPLGATHIDIDKLDKRVKIIKDDQDTLLRFRCSESIDIKYEEMLEDMKAGGLATYEKDVEAIYYKLATSLPI